MIHKHITTLSMARSGHNFVLQNVLSWFEYGNKYVHHNLENIQPIRLRHNHLNHDGYKLLIWRDFDDWLASVIMKSYKVQATRHVNDIPSYIDNIIKTYDAILQEAEHPQYYRANSVIHYDSFVDSVAYRQNICRNLYGEYSEDMLNHVPSNGHHSSFDGKDFIDNGSKMNVLNRSADILKTEHADFFNKIMKRHNG